MQNQPTDEEILNAVKKSGFLMEQETGTLIEDLGFNVETNRAFEDSDESKSREMDVWGYKNFYTDEANKISIGIELICECKNNSNPFIFVTRRKNERDKNFPNPHEYLFPLQEYKQTTQWFDNGNEKSWRMIPVFQHLNLADNHYYYKTDTKAVQFFTMVPKGKGWEANHGGIFDSIFYPIVKGYLSRRKVAERIRNHNGIKDNVWKFITLFFPIVVLQGDIYIIDSMAENPQPRKVPFVTFNRELKSKQIDGKFTVDFVQKAELQNFIEQQIQPFVEAVVGIASEDPEILTKKNLN